MGNTTEKMADGKSLNSFYNHANIIIEPEIRRKAIADREDEYHAKRLKAVLSPIRSDPFADGE